MKNELLESITLMLNKLHNVKVVTHRMRGFNAIIVFACESFKDLFMITHFVECANGSVEVTTDYRDFSEPGVRFVLVLSDEVHPVIEPLEPSPDPISDLAVFGLYIIQELINKDICTYESLNDYNLAYMHRSPRSKLP